MAIQGREHIFVSYNHSDKKWLDMLQTMLKPLIQQDKFNFWDDSQILPGTQWYEEIRKAIASAKVAVLLVSAEFLASNFIVQHELPLLYVAEKEGLTILWIAVSHCLYRYTDLAAYQALNNPGRPLNTLSKAQLNKELVRICGQIKKAMDAAPRPSVS